VNPPVKKSIKPLDLTLDLVKTFNTFKLVITIKCVNLLEKVQVVESKKAAILEF
jgi:hypothetical protein